MPTIKGMTEFLNTFRQRIQARLGEDASKTYADASTQIEQIAERQAKEGANTEEQEEIDEFEKEKDDAWTKFLSAVISGNNSPIPMHKEVEEDDEFGGTELVSTVQAGPSIGLAQFATALKMKTAHDVVQGLNGVWSGKGAAKFAVPLLMAISKQNGTPMDEATAIAQVKATGITPVQDNKNIPISKPAQAAPAASAQQPAAAKPAMAATDVHGMLGKLLQWRGGQ